MFFGSKEIDEMLRNSFMLDEKMMPAVPRSIDFMANVHGDEKSVWIECKVPGYEKDEISVNVKDKMLVIHCEKEEKTENENADVKNKCIHREYKVGTMERAFKIDDVDYTKAEAKLEKGILTITLPRVNHPETTIAIN